MTTTARDNPLMIRLRSGKNHCCGRVPGTSSLTTAPAASMSLGKRSMLRRIHDVHAGAEYGNRRAARRERAAMRGGVDAARRPADDHQTPRREIGCASCSGDGEAIRRRGARSDDRDGRARSARSSRPSRPQQQAADPRSSSTRSDRQRALHGIARDGSGAGAADRVRGDRCERQRDRRLRHELHAATSRRDTAGGRVACAQPLSGDAPAPRRQQRQAIRNRADRS